MLFRKYAWKQRLSLSKRFDRPEEAIVGYKDKLDDIVGDIVGGDGVGFEGKIYPKIKVGIMGLGAGFDDGTLFPIDGVGLGDKEEDGEGGYDNIRCSLHKLNRSKILLVSVDDPGDKERLDDIVGDIVVGEGGDGGEGLMGVGDGNT